MTSQPIDATRLDEIATRAAHLYEYATSQDSEGDTLAGEDVPALLAEIQRLTAERDAFADRVDTLTAVAKGNKRHVQEMFTELQKAQARVRELEHPAIEAKRNEIRSSFTSTIAQAQEDRDHEGAFALESQLREREEQWKREDEEAGQ
ncbi:hypothetical protein [Streptomyces sp. NPDC055733]